MRPFGVTIGSNAALNPSFRIRLQCGDLGHVPSGDARLIGNPALAPVAPEDPAMLFEPGEQAGGAIPSCFAASVMQIAQPQQLLMAATFGA